MADRKWRRRERQHAIHRVDRGPRRHQERQPRGPGAAAQERGGPEQAGHAQGLWQEPRLRGRHPGEARARAAVKICLSGVCASFIHINTCIKTRWAGNGGMFMTSLPAHLVYVHLFINAGSNSNLG